MPAPFVTMPSLAHQNHFNGILVKDIIVGICAQTVLARALGAPIIRPKTITNQKLLEIIKARKAEKGGKQASAKPKAGK